ncbi:glutamate ligase domain-containing protein, partial [Methanobrevibacter sp.]|uniref:glutamate ligase domain-containing protein n=1 Tax=Methanobrevibacter sp. TaxID=66852 RepID=UPI00388E3583
ERPYSLVIPYGLDYQNGKVLETDSENPFLRVNIEGRTISTNLVGSYNADNVMAALCVGKEFGIGFEEACKAIEAYIPSNNRSQMTRTESNTLIIDAYNANPTSMDAAIRNFSAIKAEKKAMMLGDMLELGEDSGKEHIEVIRKVLNTDADLICLVGKEFSEAVKAENDGKIHHFMTSAELGKWLGNNPLKGFTVLIKGSRGTRMEKIVEKL